jgi:hypothetical protein
VKRRLRAERHLTLLLRRVDSQHLLLKELGQQEQSLLHRLMEMQESQQWREMEPIAARSLGFQKVREDWTEPVGRRIVQRLGSPSLPTSPPDSER